MEQLPPAVLAVAAKSTTSTNQYNFGPVSSRDDFVYTCSRPGFNSCRAADGTTSTTATKSYDQQVQAIDDWIHFMNDDQQGVTNVIALLDENELLLVKNNNETDTNRPAICLQDVYTKADIPYLIQPINDNNAYTTIMEYIDAIITMTKMDDTTATTTDAHVDTTTTNTRTNSSQQQQLHTNSTTGSKVVIHCSSGSGRAGLVAAAWLVYKYGCTPAAATAEVLEQALQCHVHRKGNVERLEAFVNNDMQAYVNNNSNTMKQQQQQQTM